MPQTLEVLKELFVSGKIADTFIRYEKTAGRYYFSFRRDKGDAIYATGYDLESALLNCIEMVKAAK